MSHGTASLLGGKSSFNPVTTPLLVGTASGAEPVVGQVNISNSGADATLTMLSYGGANYIRGYQAAGTQGSPTAAALNATLLSFNAGGYNSAAFTGTKAQIAFIASQLWTETANGTRINFYTTLNGSTTLADFVSITEGALSVGRNNRSMAAAWGATGTLFHVLGTTITDGASSGTVASAVASSYAAPAFAATSATTFTDAATVYIAGAPTAGSGATLTNSYALWIDSGRIRYDETASASAATASTHKVPINIGGTLYYILLTNV